MSNSDQYIQDAIEIALASAEKSGSKLVTYFLQMALYEHKETSVINKLKPELETSAKENSIHTD